MKLLIFCLSVCSMFSPLCAIGQCRDIEDKLNGALSDLGADRGAGAWVGLESLLDDPMVKECDDGGIAEGISDLTVRLLLNIPDGLPHLAEWSSTHHERYLFVLKHLDGTASCDDLVSLERILRYKYGTVASLDDARTKVIEAINETKCPSVSSDKSVDYSRKVCSEAGIER